MLLSDFCYSFQFGCLGSASGNSYFIHCKFATEFYCKNKFKNLISIELQFRFNGNERAKIVLHAKEWNKYT